MIYGSQTIEETLIRDLTCEYLQKMLNFGISGNSENQWKNDLLKRGVPGGGGTF